MTINNITSYIIRKLSSKNIMPITSIIHKENGKYLLYELSNNSLSSHKEVLFNIYRVAHNLNL